MAILAVFFNFLADIFGFINRILKLDLSNKIKCMYFDKTKIIANKYKGEKNEKKQNIHYIMFNDTYINGMRSEGKCEGRK